MMKKCLGKVAAFSAFVLGGLFLVSCSKGEATTAPTTTTTSTTTVPTTTSTQVEVNDTPVEAGKYMYRDTVIEFDKTNKKMKAIKYETYDQYKNNTGTVLYDKAVKYIDYEGEHAVYGEEGTTNYTLYKNGNKVTIIVRNGTQFNQSTATPLTTVVEPSYGTYVSEKLEQYKLGPDGRRISDGEGGYQKEDFYLFLEITATSAKVYVGDNNTTHDATPLYTKDNYVCKFMTGIIRIEIPHTNTTYKCSLAIVSEDTIEFVNDSEDSQTDSRYADYSGSGDFTKIS